MQNFLLNLNLVAFPPSCVFLNVFVVLMEIKTTIAIANSSSILLGRS